MNYICVLLTCPQTHTQFEYGMKFWKSKNNIRFVLNMVTQCRSRSNVMKNIGKLDILKNIGTHKNHRSRLITVFLFAKQSF